MVMYLVYECDFPPKLQERLQSHGLSSTGFPGSGHRASDFQHPYFPPPFPTAQAQQTAQEVFAAQSAQHLAATDPYNVNSLHSHFQTSQVSLHFVYQSGVLCVPSTGRSNCI